MYNDQNKPAYLIHVQNQILQIAKDMFNKYEALSLGIESEFMVVFKEYVYYYTDKQIKRRNVFLKYAQDEVLFTVDNLIHLEISEGDIYVIGYFNGNVSM